jgi:DNA-directed RNA polymerase specialized sigma24 family protein
MTYSEPPRERQEQQHQRLLLKDPVAFAEICEGVLPHLVSFLGHQFPQHDAHMCEMVAIDCLLAYQQKPDQFDPVKLSLFAYLRMAARRDMLNAIDKQQRRDRRLYDIEDPQVQSQLPEQGSPDEEFDLTGWLAQRTDYSLQEILEKLSADLSMTDKQVLMLMLDNVRETERYAQVMAITHLEELEQRQTVKRAKDRIVKKLQRFGQRIEGN